MSIEITVKEGRFTRLDAATYDPKALELLQSFAGDPITKIVIYTKPKPIPEKLRKKL